MRDKLIEILKYRRHLETSELADVMLENDIITVVRCKDCEYCDRCFPAKAIGEEPAEGLYCHPNRRYVKPDDFCSFCALKGGEG